VRFRGEVALVTGAGSGIGRAIALALAAEGAKVAVVDRVAERAERVASEVEARSGVGMAQGADVSVESDVEQAVSATVAALGPVSVLVNNASRGTGDGVLQIDRQTWDGVLAVALTGAFLFTRATLPGMLERGGGVILNVASVNGLTSLGQEAYSAAKAGLISLTRSVAVRYGRQGVRCNVLAPATVRTPAWDARLRQDPSIFDRLAAWYPLGRVGEPEDVAAAALFLCSDEAAWITGVVLPVDGGLLAGNLRMAEDLLLREGRGRDDPPDSGDGGDAPDGRDGGDARDGRDGGDAPDGASGPRSLST
jgi:meso-butanediol dehydrogenase / (S,S)-butanediol dehydrogenase / diacetyl reductase